MAVMYPFFLTVKYFFIVINKIIECHKFKRVLVLKPPSTNKLVLAITFLQAGQVVTYFANN
jgi:hypothetical protein